MGRGKDMGNSCYQMVINILEISVKICLMGMEFILVMMEASKYLNSKFMPDI